MKLDLHTHTSRHSLCSLLEPQDLIKEIERAGLDGVVITEHDKVWSAEEIAELKKLTGTRIKIFSGQEVSTSGGHILVYGCGLSFDYDITPEELSKKVRKNGGVTFSAHPFRYPDSNFCWEDGAGRENYFRQFDGAEFLNGNQSYEQNKFALAEYKRMNITGISGSDAHSPEMAGRFFTVFKNKITNGKELIGALRDGECFPARSEGAGAGGLLQT